MISDDCRFKVALEIMVSVEPRSGRDLPSWQVVKRLLIKPRYTFDASRKYSSRRRAESRWNSGNLISSQRLMRRRKCCRPYPISLGRLASPIGDGTTHLIRVIAPPAGKLAQRSEVTLTGVLISIILRATLLPTTYPTALNSDVRPIADRQPMPLVDHHRVSLSGMAEPRPTASITGSTRPHGRLDSSWSRIAGRFEGRMTSSSSINPHLRSVLGKAT
jgi:hypothetical protein